MKIVNREAFLKLPANTLFSTYEPCIFGDIAIKGENCGTDFFRQNIRDAIENNSSEDFFAKLDHAQKTGASLAMDFEYEGRDGLFEEGQLFAVWEKADVASLIERLRRCL
jgi:hypothetical protein